MNQSALLYQEVRYIVAARFVSNRAGIALFPLTWIPVHVILCVSLLCVCACVCVRISVLVILYVSLVCVCARARACVRT